MLRNEVVLANGVQVVGWTTAAKELKEAGCHRSLEVRYHAPPEGLEEAQAAGVDLICRATRTAASSSLHRDKQVDMEALPGAV